MARTQDRVHDVLVIGGGLVGASLAIALDRIGVDVGLVEATPAGALPEVFDQRSLTFADASLNALTALGVMQALRAPVGDIRRIHVSRRGDFGQMLLRAEDYGHARFGQVVVARDFGMALEAVLAEAQRVTRYRPARFVGTADQADRPEEMRRIRIALPEGEIELQTRLLVGADGSDSAVRSALHIGQARHDYAQSLLVARLRSAHAPDGTAFERFGDHGPIALLPRGDGHFGLVLGVAKAEADVIAAAGDAEFLQRAQDA
ncbi:MAG TPA: FAD-dependent monooxygenase, partial [Xanthomonadaceae bacterium]|nr:FAD-dependent monooxygenase [Xanthomonadaceae bacterium]